MRTRGFTLLEVLVALAILAIALSASMRAIGVAAGQASDVRDRIVADWVAQNVLAELRIRNQFLDAGSGADGDVEQAGIKFHWHQDVKATPNPLFRRVEVKVYLAGGSTPLTQLTGFLSRAAQ